MIENLHRAAEAAALEVAHGSDPQHEHDPHAEQQCGARHVDQEPVHHAVVGHVDQAVQRAQADVGPGRRDEARRRTRP